MPWDPKDTYKDFYATVIGIENPLALEIHVDPASNDGAQALCFYTGTLKLSRPYPYGDFESPLKQSPDFWSRGVLEFDIPTPGRIWTFIPSEGVPQPTSPTHPDLRNPGSPPTTYFHGGTVVLSLASIYNENVANNAGWAVDGADVYAQGNEAVGLHVVAAIAVRDSDGFLYRLSYQVTALGQSTPAIGGVVLG